MKPLNMAPGARQKTGTCCEPGPLSPPSIVTCGSIQDHGPGPRETTPAADTGCGCVLPPKKPSSGDVCCGSAPAVTFYREGPWITGRVHTPAGTVPTVTGRLTAKDRLEHFLARVSEFRMGYAVRPGLYALGNPGPDSEVLVSANYKMSFDVLRHAADDVDAWILVLDTSGINVWCAAGKGTFGTDELARRVTIHGLHLLVNHRRLIVPQLGAPGVSAHEVRKRTGFTVLYGPVLARDIPRYLTAGRRASPAMRNVPFGIMDRLVLVPMEIIPAMKRYPIFALGALAVAGLMPGGIFFDMALRDGLPLAAAGLAGILAGSLVMPLLLPFIPFRSLAAKGWIAGVAVILTLERLTPLFAGATVPLMAALYVLFPLVSSYLGLLFTGTTAYTGISGVKKEMRYALPLYRAGLVLSAVLVGIHKLIQWGIL